ncbi:hypothetical protein R5R35_006517 [Gryllus longicercus]|uniref:ATP synthase subunit s, mitochondrial n=1 Tax=Gryllus longicercus TaxID=2509291 RepID=A0AAN9V7R3_9ORTH
MNIPRITYYSRRHFWAWLNIVWNRVDNDRIQEVGPDLACAEWLMRNGALVKWAGKADYLKDYDSLKEGEGKGGYYIEEIDATEASIMHVGFPHFHGCKHIKKIKLQRCSNVEDKALKSLEILKNSLQHLQVISCGNVTDKGVKSLTTLVNLETLLLYDLPEVKCCKDCALILQESLPKCQVDYRVTEHPHKRYHSTADCPQDTPEKKTNIRE